MTDDELMSIGDFAAASGLTAKALRLYDELDLLPPAEVDPANGYRRYAPGQLGQARLVARLRLVGVSLARIRTLTGLPPAAAATELRHYWRQVEADTASRRELVASLVADLTAQEATMPTTTHDWTVRTAVRDAIGTRELHEDATYAGSSVFAVADGFRDGADAARTVIAAVAALDGTEGDAHALLGSAVERAAETVRAAGRGGSTLTAAWLRGDHVAVAHIGDSRLYRLRDGVLEQLTRDHTIVAGLVEEGRLTEEEARCHPDRVLINRAIAPDTPSPEADLSAFDVHSGDRLVLTTDGVHGQVPAEELRALLTGGEPQSAVDRVAAAIEAAGAPDNYAVVVADLS